MTQQDFKNANITHGVVTRTEDISEFLESRKRHNSDSIELELFSNDRIVSKYSHQVSEGEKEDMVFGRNLHNLDTIELMMSIMQIAGKLDVPIRFTTAEPKR
jgi:hypothetical protein